MIPSTPLLFAVSLAAIPAASDSAAELILQHGVFYTAEAAGRVEGSLAVRDGKILYLGPTAGAEALRGPRTEILDLAGRTAVPGLIDAHAHLAGLGAALESVDLRAAATFSEVVQRVARAAREVPAGTWIFGRGWDQNLWPEREFPRHQLLSSALAAHPVWLSRVDGHAALLNARALAAVGIDRDTPDPPGGRILRDSAGDPTGVLVDNAMELASARLPEASAAQRERRIALAARLCLALGLTTVTDMGIGSGDWQAYSNLAQRGELPIRTALFLADEPQLLAQWFERGWFRDPRGRLQLRGVKLYADGALGSRGAALVEPYSDDPGNLGLLTSSQDHLEEVARAAMAAGFQVAIHTIGDRGGLVALDALEQAMAGEPRPDLRARLEHAQVLRPQDIERLARLGIIASMQPTHATSDMPWAEARVGPRRILGAYAWRRVLAAGGRLALGSDFPVESADPRLGLYAAVTRKDLAGTPPSGWHPEEVLTREEALRGFTLDAAYALFLDREVGSLAVGKRADLVIFDGDIMTVPEAEIPLVPVDYTLVDGRIAYRREGAR